MGSERVNRRICRWQAVPLVLLAAAWLVPSQARASCGDYVTIGAKHAAQAAQAKMTGQRTGDAEDDDTSPAGPGPLCHGPHCSNGSFPPASPVPEVQTTIERYAHASAAAPFAVLRRSSLIAEPGTQLARIERSGILRPPR